MTPEQIERKRATQRECMRRRRAAMSADELEAKRRANREYMRRARLENPERQRAAERRYKEVHRESVAYRDFCRHLENRDVANERKAEWEKANPERRRRTKRASEKRCAARPENKEAARKRSRLRSIRSVKDKVALGHRIMAAAEAVAGNVNDDLRREIISRLIEGVYTGRFPIRLKAEHRAEIVREHFRQFSKFDTVSLDEVIGEDGFTRGAALGIL